MKVTDKAEDGFEATIHAPNRLRICALLEAAEQVEFGLVRERLGVSDSVLSKHVSVLMDAGYVQQTKGVRDTRQRVWLSLTKSGRAAYRAHVAALRAIVGEAQE
ncbi:transcriptional regulator [Streptosporangium roseum]|uniref:Transcriptional regulator, MarR/EmrR family protein n=1 Tax=Streptosporangium roseum (strain ATCC 12428 / DSM 43021 / JCM 3005 / KCTC 9067 / NCIMB 10171 / NRRL 2505 / NI 9100) TaxID=479432 RepID=D2BDM1_STRRD|nr:transcriptional regulator [Streptosporangium roseum]ACZ88113.1 transcriptional regulator, MarR/EmrR family protein [Streptosporangium roseum DSM 43021]